MKATPSLVWLVMLAVVRSKGWGLDQAAVEADRALAKYLERFWPNDEVREEGLEY